MNVQMPLNNLTPPVLNDNMNSTPRDNPSDHEKGFSTQYNFIIKCAFHSGLAGFAANDPFPKDVLAPGENTLMVSVTKTLA